MHKQVEKMETTNKHFRLTEETIQWQGRTLHRIEATRDSYWANAGDLGGFVESEDNLTNESWVADEAKVWGGARLWHYSTAYGSAQIFDDCNLLEGVVVSGEARVHGANTFVTAAAHIHGGEIKDRTDYMVFQGFEDSEILTAYRDTNDMPSIILGGSWYTLPNFIRWAKQRYENNPDRLEEVRLITELIRKRFDKE